jgi:hypothetical protein
VALYLNSRLAKDTGQTRLAAFFPTLDIHADLLHFAEQRDELAPLHSITSSAQQERFGNC